MRIDPDKKYLGDGVYVTPNRAYPGGLILTTENGLAATNTIFLEPEVLTELQTFIQGMRKKAAVEAR